MNTTDLSESVTIRERREGDLPGLGKVLVEVHERDGYPVEGVSDPIGWLRSSRSLAAWVGLLDGEPVAHVQLTAPAEDDAAAYLWAEQSGADLDAIAVLGRLFVSARARGQHLGQRLAVIAVDHARGMGRRAVLDVMAKDAAAIRTYEGLGWQRIAEIQHRTAEGQVPAYAYVSPE